MFCSRSLAVGFLAIGTLISAAPARADTHEEETIAFDAIITNTCTGEDIHLTGDLHRSLRFVFHNNSAQIILHVNFQHVHGVGLTSGTEYTATNAVNDVLNFTNGPLEEETFVQRFQLISRGSSSNEVAVEALFHLIVTPNGDMKLTMDQYDTNECQGAS